MRRVNVEDWQLAQCIEFDLNAVFQNPMMADSKTLLAEVNNGVRTVQVQLLVTADEDDFCNASGVDGDHTGVEVFDDG